MVFQFTSWHLTLGGIKRSNQGHLVFIRLYIILSVLLDSGVVRPRGLLFMEVDFIECFTTTFLRTHSWLNWVDEDDDEDEVGLKEKPEDTRYIKKITSK